MTNAVRRVGNKCLIDIEISVQISETAGLRSAYRLTM